MHDPIETNEAALSSVSVVDGVRELERARRESPLVRLYDCEGALQALVVARLAAHQPAFQRPLVVVTPDEAAATALARDLRTFLPESRHRGAEPASPGRGAGGSEPSHGSDEYDPLGHPRILELPAFETSPYSDVAADRRAVARKLATLFRLSQGLVPDVLVVSAPALQRKVIPRAAFADLVDVVMAKQSIDRDRTIDLLVRGGYTRMPVVEDPGTFAVRGGVIDVFVPLYRFPLRIELFGDEVESLRFFDPETQRTMRAVDEAYLHPVRETVLTRGARLRERLLEASDHASHPSSKTRAILDQLDKGEDFFGVEALTPAFHERLASIAEYLPDGATLFLDDPEAILQRVDDDLDEAATSYQARVEEHRLAFPASDFYLSVDDVRRLFDGRRRIEAHRLEIAEARPAPAVRLRAETNRDLVVELERARGEKHEELLRPLIRRLAAYRDEGTRVVLYASSLAHAERLESLLKGYQVIPIVHRSGTIDDLLDARAQRTSVEIALGPLHRGFHLPLDHVAVIAEAEIFGDKAVRRAPRRQKGKGFPQDGLKHLEPGAYVVHQLHGVGVYKGLTKLPLRTSLGAKRDVAVDFLHLEYEGGALYLPVWRLNEIQAYSGAEGISPKIDKLGGVTWEKTRGKVSKEIRQLAEELLQLYAQRRSLPGHSLALTPNMEQLFREFEATFPFEETPDQQRAIDDVLADLDKPHPMDRLVCGDVGYGKTEVALRAALKAALAGKQVAFLAPTTVLVEQHALTLKSRFAAMPVRVASISRFKDRAEQVEVLKGLADGKVDIVVGTHRLLSADVRFKDLGLLIIDEEQRFGVSHKEKLKKLKTQVDVLTLSATPIPRTLHMAMMGLRDLSVITTPPADRLAIRTVVCRFSEKIIEEAVKRELARGGQCFFVHNRIEDIHAVAETLRAIVPGVRVVVGHGQMPPEELEKVMIEFVDGQADILCCTTIIESGLDIPRANTMFVDRADTFGLAQLYQIRGRIGRSRERAYCYLLIPGEEAGLSGDAKARLAVLQRFTELGAGFQIASHDLELRGAGDLLGARQSGAIAAVGFETYTQLLEEAVASLRGEPIHHELDPELTCDLPGFIPEDYLPDVGQRLEFYRRLSSAAHEDEIRDILGELTDRYGPVTPEIEVLADIMIVKGLGRRLGARAIELNESRFALALLDDTPLKPDQVMKLVQKKGSPWKLTPDMRLSRNFVQGEREKRLEVAKALLSELLTQATSA
jgi:transcription-repair coupling factor (superfamily II helicase)